MSVEEKLLWATVLNNKDEEIYRLRKELAEAKLRGDLYLTMFEAAATDSKLPDGTYPHLGYCSGNHLKPLGELGSCCCCRPERKKMLKEIQELKFQASYPDHSSNQG